MFRNRYGTSCAAGIYDSVGIPHTCCLSSPVFTCRSRRAAHAGQTGNKKIPNYATLNYSVEPPLAYGPLSQLYQGRSFSPPPSESMPGRVSTSARNSITWTSHPCRVPSTATCRRQARAIIAGNNKPGTIRCQT
ncbi:hypothetical protein PoB_003573000 [Plakobranchus ocellatus]|uniref:Uncharacterized protein n=1 Tax=Plakobranchus ocellatus TaxID=259542 RepID=A0AAV4AQS7_9GAST|nr:hypothetical protein PoB_003573000 [Plakobranchus ocellatus]